MQLTKSQPLVTRKFILSKISDYDIYRWEIGEFTVGKSILSPLRKDSNPSFSVYLSQDGKLHHIDYADERYRGDCFDLVCQKYGIELIDALNKLAKDFFLIDSPPDAYKAITSQYTKPVMDIKRHSLIQVTTKKLTVKDLQYWNQYLIDKEDLKKEDIYSVKDLFLNRKKIVTGKDELVFAYYYPEGFKIYMPEREKEHKWLSNITTARVENIKTLDTNSRIVVTKAKKCRICLSKLIDGVVNVQNESRSCFTDIFIKQLSDKEVYIQYDSDVAGKKNSMALTSSLGYKHLNVPDPMFQYGVKDFSDWIKYDRNTKRVEDFLKLKKII